MDKEVLRIVIIATGLLMILVMLLWSFIKNRQQQKNRDEDYSSTPNTGYQSPLFDGDDDFEVIPLNTKKSLDETMQSRTPPVDFAYDEAARDLDEPIEPRFASPAIIQFSLIANADEGFNGADLDHAFSIAGLEYGSLKIYERLDPNRLVDFGVACMVEPGIFPEQGMEHFYTPGLVFFMQPEALDDAQSVFDDYVQTIHYLAKELDGEILDHQRKPLTETTVQKIRQSL